jgi:hypothetical protein
MTSVTHPTMHRVLVLQDQQGAASSTHQHSAAREEF